MRLTTSADALLLLPLVTVLREGLEAVIFLGGVSLGQEAKSIPIAAIVGLLCGFSVGLLIWFFSHRRLNIRCVGRANRTDRESIFMVISTSFLLLIGAGLFSKAIGSFERYTFTKMCVAAAAITLTGQGRRRRRRGWRRARLVPCAGQCRACAAQRESLTSKEASHVRKPRKRLRRCVSRSSCSCLHVKGQGWSSASGIATGRANRSVFNAVLGWTNNATIGSILSYVFYWLAVIVALVYLKWAEGRLVVFGHESKLGRQRRERREARQLETQPELETAAPGSRLGTPLQSPALDAPKELFA